MNDIILEFRNVYFKWAEGLSLQNINIRIKKGSFTLITGPSGSGKSTVLRLACRLEEPEKGALLYDGELFDTIPPPKLRQKVALIQQTPTVIEGSVRENLLLPYSFEVNKNIPKPEDKLLKEKLKELYLNADLNKEAYALSVGQKQRLCILRTLLLEPDILLMDEPTSALDQESKEIVEKILEETNKKGTTIIMVSHSKYRPGTFFTRLHFRNGTYEEI